MCFFFSRKLKNRVAAQTARDRKKCRMDELESQVKELTEKVTDLSAVINSLSEHNVKLEQENKLLRRQTSQRQCTCNTVSNNSSSVNVLQVKPTPGNKAPVLGVTEESAELPQLRAVTLRAAIRALFLSLVCAQSETPLEDVKMHLQDLDKKGVRLAKPLLEELSTWDSSQPLYKWMDHHQPPWVMAQ